MNIRVGYKMTEIGEIPEDWEVRHLSEVSSIVMGQSPKGISYNKSGQGLPLLNGAADFEGNKIKPRQFTSQPTKVSSKGDLIFCIRATIGNIAIADQQYCLGRGVAALRTKDLVNKDFLIQVLQTQFEFLTSISAGSVIKGIKKDDLERLAIPMPPLPEQHKIASILSTVDDSIKKTDAVIEKTETLKRGLMQRLLTRGIGHTDFKQTELGEIPDIWEINRLGALYSIYDCKHRTPNYTETGYPTIRPRDITPFITSFDSCLKTSYADYLDLTEKYTPKKGDIVYSRNASYGVAGIVLTNKKFSIGQDTVIITSDKLSTRYLFYVLNSNLIGKQIRRISTGSTFKRINLSEIRKLKIPIPPISEQKHIASILWSLDSKLKTENRRRQKLAELKKGLMKDLLTGKVRVKVD